MEIFRVFGSLALMEDGNIEDRLHQVTDSAGGVDKAFGIVSKGIGILGTALVGIGTIVTTVVVGSLTKATKFADEFNDSLQELKASTGTTEEGTKDLGDALKNVYKAGYGDDIRDVAEAMKEVKQQTGLTGKALEDQTKKVITLSKTMDLDYGETVKTVDNLMKNLNLTSDEAFELIVQGWENGLNANGDYLDVLNEYSVQIDKAGLTADEFFSIMKAGHENGVFSLDKLIDAQKEFNVRSIDGSKGTMEAYDELGFSYDEYAAKIAKGGEEGKKAQQEIIQALLDEDDQVKQNQLGVALFGTMWEDLGPKGISSLLGIDEGMDKTKNHMDELIDTNFDSIAEAFTIIGRSIEVNLLLPVGQKIVPVILKAIDKIKKGAAGLKKDLEDKFKPLFDFMDEHLEDIKKAFNGLFEFIMNGNFDQSVEDLKEALSNLFPDMDVDNFILKLADLRETIEGIIEKISEIWDSESVQNYLNILEEAVPKIEELIGKMVDAYLGFMDAIGEFSDTEAFNEMIKSIERLVLLSLPALVGGVQLFLGLGRIFYETLANIVRVFDILSNTFLTVKEAIGNFSISVSETIVGLVDGIIGFFKYLWDKLVGHSIIPDMVKDIIKWIGKLPGKIAMILLNLITNAIIKFNEFKASASKKISEAVNKIKTTFEKIIGKIRNIISKVISAGRTKFNEFKKAVGDKVSETVSKAKEVFEKVIGKIKKVIGTLIKAGKKKMGEFKTAITKKLENIDLYQTGKDIVQGLIKGLGSLLGSVKKKAGEIAKAVEDALKDKLKLKSPSRLMYDIGVNVVKGLNLGLEDSNAISNLKSSSDVMYKQLSPSNGVSNNTNDIRNISKSVNIDKIIIDPRNIKELNDIVELFENLIHENNMIST